MSLFSNICKVDQILCSFFFFFLMIRPPPSSPLFPYTTLFRPPSGSAPTMRNRSPATESSAPTRQRRPGRTRARQRRSSSRAKKSNSTGRPPGSRARTDRKSTRLNSSHGYISYAVFCLKKKTSIMENTNLSKQQQVSEIMRQMLTQAQTAGQYFTNDQIKEMTRKVSAEVDLVHQQTQNQRYDSSHIGATAKDIYNVVTDAASGVVDIFFFIDTAPPDSSTFPLKDPFPY